MSIWEQVASIAAVSEGYFDDVQLSKTKEAQDALLTNLWSNHTEMKQLSKGDKKFGEDKAIYEIVKNVMSKSERIPKLDESFVCLLRKYCRLQMAKAL